MRNPEKRRINLLTMILQTAQGIKRRRKKRIF
jgi:hypothetical protein